ncbi:MAG: hypothetical protein JNK82_00030 [Myxococcaceae bacterium]|nr:hypothetical protein [Myxococcaceae bacterium]
MRGLFAVMLLVVAACDVMRMTRDRETVKNLTPAPLSKPSVATAAVKRVVRVRVAVDDAYAAENREYNEHIRALFARATEFAQPRYGVSFELVSFDRWEHPLSGDIHPLVGQLATQHPADGAHLVVGFTSSLPLFASDFEQIGAAQLFGHHMVLRGIDAHAYTDYLERELKTVGDDEKRGVVRARVHHQETAVFLHEWGHALGALHDRDLEHLMCPQYRDSLRDFSAASEKMIRLGLEHLDDSDGRAWLAAARVAHEELPASAFMPNERESLWAVPDGGTAGPARASVSAPLSETDRKLFQIAIDKQAEGRAADSLATALTVLKRNPKNAQLTSFVCAMSLNTKAADVLERCKTAAALAPDDARPALWLGWALADAKDAAGARAAADDAAARLERGERSVELDANLAELYRRLGCTACAEKRAKPSDMPLASDAAEAPEGGGDDKVKRAEAFDAVVAELKAKRTSKAIEKAQALTKAYPGSAMGWALSCEAQIELRPPSARAACERALKLDGALGRAHYLLAALDEASNHKGDAIAHLEKVVVSNEGANVDAWHRLARLYRGYRMTAAVDALAVKYQKRFGRALP